MGLIKMNYSEVFQEADRLANLAETGEQYLREMRNTKNGIPGIWQGEASNAFVNACGIWEKEMVDLVRTLQNISQNLRTIAREIQEAEARARAAMESAARASATSTTTSGSTYKPNVQPSNFIFNIPRFFKK